VTASGSKYSEPPTAGAVGGSFMLRQAAGDQWLAKTSMPPSRVYAIVL
jgi:hypothetical protein